MKGGQLLFETRTSIFRELPHVLFPRLGRCEAAIGDKKTCIRKTGKEARPDSITLFRKEGYSWMNAKEHGI